MKRVAVESTCMPGNDGGGRHAATSKRRAEARARRAERKRQQAAEAKPKKAKEPAAPSGWLPLVAAIGFVVVLLALAALAYKFLMPSQTSAPKPRPAPKVVVSFHWGAEYTDYPVVH